MATFADDCLAGKRVLVTGALGALGREIVRALLGSGAAVVANDVVGEADAARIAQDCGWAGERFTYLGADITKSEEVERLIEAAGPVEIALCHAGVVESHPILEYPEAAWRRILDVNLSGSFLVASAVARRMIRESIRGRIIFTSSWVQDVPWPEIVPYTVSKSGIRTLMRGMARELAGNGIRVNCLAPGIVGAGMAKKQWDTEPEYRRRAEKAIPLGSLQTPESVAEAMIFLCSDASGYMTGATLLVDGGCSLYPMD